MLQDSPNARVANGRLSADVCTRPTFCVAVGSFADRLGSSALAELWDGKRWSLQTVPIPSGASEGALQGVSCSSASACVAVGHYTAITGAELTLAEAWNGTAWSVQPTPDPAGATSSALESVSCGPNDSCIGVGYYIHTRRIQKILAERWNGTDWTLQKTANPVDDSDSVLDGVSCPVTNSCVAVGYYLDSDTWVTLAEDWNGHEWTVLVTPNPPRSIVASFYGVSCIAAATCTAVGDFVRSSGKLLAKTLVEAWNGSVWTIEVSPNPIGTVSIDTLESVACTSAKSCRAVGYCTHATGSGATTLAEVWNGSAWTIQSTPNPGRSDTSLYGLSCTSTGACTAVGFYRNESGTYLTLTEVSKGNAWVVRASPDPNGVGSSVLESVSCTSSVLCIAVGSFANSPSTRMTLAEAWNGADWAIQTTPNPNATKHNVLESVSCTSSVACMAVGRSYGKRGTSTLAEEWNGTTWRVQATPNPGGKGAELTGVSCSAATACTAVGYYVSDLDLPLTLAEAWNGVDWTIENTPNPTGNDSPVLQGVSCTSPMACTAVGNYTSDAALVGLVERWDGSIWTIQSTPTGDDNLYGVSCSSATACTAVGNAYGYPSGISPLAEAWNGDSWSLKRTPDPVSFFSSFYGVSCRSGSDCTAVGGYDNSAGVGETLAEAWNGTRWTIQPTPNPKYGSNSVLAAVSGPSADNLIAVGNHLNRAGISVTLGETKQD